MGHFGGVEQVDDAGAICFYGLFGEIFESNLAILDKLKFPEPKPPKLHNNFQHKTPDNGFLLSLLTPIPIISIIS